MVDYVLSGRILFPDGISEGTIGITGGVIEFVDLGEVQHPRDGDIISGLIAPGLIDMHAHLGDHGARGKIPSSLKDVMFPGGLKHRFLDSSDDETLTSSIVRSLEELHPGVTRVIDFREGGLKGLSLLEKAAGSGLPRVHGFGRPVEGEDLERLLSSADGLGIPSLEGASMELRNMAREAGKPYSVHASELYREDINFIKDLEPELLVHMVSSSKEDMKEIADCKIPTVICPRSNSAFSLETPINDMLTGGMAIGLGTDNSISVRQDMFREMEFSWILARKQGFNDDDLSLQIFKMAVGAHIPQEKMKFILHDHTHWTSPDWLRIGTIADLMVVKDNFTGSDPVEDIVRFTGQGDVLFSSSF